MKIALVMWRRGMRGVGLEAAASPASHSQGRSGEGLSLANDSESERSGLGMLKIQTLGSVWASQVALVVKNSTANPGDIRYVGLIPGSGRSPGKGMESHFSKSCLENPMDRGGWWATVQRVAKSWTRLKRLSTHSRQCLFYPV